MAGNHTSRCKLCQRDDRQHLDERLLEGASRTEIADQLGVDRTSVWRHLRWTVEQMGENTTPASIENAVRHLDRLIEISTGELERWHQQPEADRSPADLERLVRSALAPLKVELARVGITTDKASLEMSGAVALTVSAEALEVAQQIHTALAPYPEARGEVAAALAKVGADAG